MVASGTRGTVIVWCVEVGNIALLIFDSVSHQFVMVAVDLQAMQHMIIPRHNMYSKDDDGEPINFR